MFSYISRRGSWRALAIALVALIAQLARSHPALAQSRDIADSLVRRALAANPQVRAADARAAAARSRVGPAGAWSDPMLMAGIQNLPVTREASPGAHVAAAGPEPMTMKMIGVSQTIPYPGKTALRTRIARAESDAEAARAETTRRRVRRDVREAYYDLAAARTLRALLERQQRVAAGIIPASEARYVSGTSSQADVLKARNEATQLATEANAAAASERAAVAALDALLDQPAGAAAPTDSLGTDLVSDSAVSVDSLIARAMASNPQLREQRAMIAAQAARAELARRAVLPDVDVTVQYGQRDRLPDMITALISVPLPIQQKRKQRAEAGAERLDLAAAEAELRTRENEVRSAVARAAAEVERRRADLVLLQRALLPQTRATFASASATYESGRSDLLGVLDAMRAMFAAEAMYVRSLAGYASARAELEALAGPEVTP